MAVVRAFQLVGLYLWFWSNDHEPPHFHAKRRGEWEVKVLFLLDVTEMIEIVWCDKPPSSKALKELTELAQRHRAELLQQWQELRDQEEL
jgi:hypothetical protein